MIKKKYTIVLTLLFSLLFNSLAFAGQHNTIDYNPSNGSNLSGAIARIRLANIPTCALGSSSVGYVMIGGQAYDEYVQVGWIKKVNSSGGIDRLCHWAEGNNSNILYPDRLYGGSISSGTVYNYQVTESSSVAGKYYFYINGVSIGSALTEGFTPKGVEAGEETVDNTSTRISGTSTSKAFVDTYKYKIGPTGTYTQIYTGTPVIQNTNFKMDVSSGVWHLYDARSPLVPPNGY